MTGMRLRALIWLLLALLVAGLAASQFSGRLPLQTNLLALLPPTERNPLAEEALNRLAESTGNRAVFLIGERTAAGAGQAARVFAASLRESAAFRGVVAEIPPIDARQVAALYAGFRFNLLADADRQALAAGSPGLAARLQRKLYAPFAFGLALPLAEDPFALTDGWLAALPLKSVRLEAQDGLLVARDAERTWIFVAAELSGSAYDGTLQREALASVAAAEQALAERHPEARVLRTGALFYAGAARASAEREVDVIGAGSLLGMLAMLYLVFRSLRPLALGLVSVGFGIAAAVVVTLAVHGEIHLIALVFGASLIGEAIDYAIQYFAAQLGAGADWEPVAGLRRIAPGLIVALATSALGYGALMLAPFPALAQIALFALVGLSAAWLTVFLLLPWLMRRPSRRDPEAAVALAQRFLYGWQQRVSRGLCAVLCLVLLALAAPGWTKLTANDDVQLLITRPADLLAQEDEIRALTGFANSSQFYLVEATTPGALLAAEEALTERLAPLVKAGTISGFQAVSSFVPSPQRQSENRALWQQQVFADRAALAHVLAEAELRDEIAGRLAGDFAASEDALLGVDDWLAAPIAQPFRQLWLGRVGREGEPRYASLVLPQGVRDVAALADAGSGLAGVTLVDKPGSVSRLFRSYRQWGALWLLGAAALVWGVLGLRYGARQAAFTLLPTLLAMTLALGVFGYLGTPVTLFHLMGLVLVLGVGVNYAIFLREGGGRGAATLAGVLLSAATTLLSFGLLAFSRMPALAGFGLSLLLGIGFAVLLAPIVLTFRERPAA